MVKSARPEVGVPGYWDTLQDNCNQWAKEITVRPFWEEAKKRLSLWRYKYRRKTGEALLSTRELPDFKAKDKVRTREKLYQQALRESSDPPFPKDPAKPAIPIMNDLVRTRITCNFMDGVEFLGQELVALAKELRCYYEHKREGRLEGYYAQHVIFEENVFFRFGGVDTPARICCEIQLASVLATRVWESSHLIYEKSRIIEEEPEDWQWNPKDPRFISRELGHMIHLADGLLVQLRDSVPRKRSTR